MTQMVMTLAPGKAYTGEADKLLNFFAEDLPAEVKNLFGKCINTFKTKEKRSSLVVNIDEILHEKGLYLGMQIGKTTKKEVLQKFKNDYVSHYQNNCYFPGLELNLCFDCRDTLQEITIEGENPGQTAKGLKIGDRVEKAVSLYGQPRIASNFSAIWKNIAITIENGLVTSIRIQ